MDIALALLMGAFIGAVLGFIGAGGAMLSVPILMYLFGFDPHQATTAALAIVFAAATAGAYPKWRTKEILFKDALVIWALGSVANISLSLIAPGLDPRVITIGFALVLIGAGLSMLYPPRLGQMKRMSWPELVVLSLIIGSMTGLFGIGGGFLAIPVLVLAFNTPHSIAAGTSLVIIALNTLTAFFAHHAAWHSFSWSIPIAMALAAVFIARWASHRSSHASPELLRKAFAILLFCISAFTLFESLT